MRRFLAWSALLLVPVLAGAVPRLWNLPEQVLGGDELHGLRAALGEPVAVILTTYGNADPCIPMALFYRLVLELGVPLSELWLRLPALLAGLAAPLLLPAALAHRLDRRERWIFAWLVALSPLLILYSRIARPYAPVVLLGFLAVAAFDRWWQGGRAAWAGLYALLAPLTVWLHLLSAPFVLAPFLFAAGGALARHRRGEETRWRFLLLLGGGIALLLAAFLWPARESLLAVAAAKSGEGSLSGETVAGALQLQAGTGRPAVAALFWATALAGLLLLLRRRGSFALYGLVLAGAHLGTLFFLAPFGVGHPLIFNRYVLILLPLFSIWVAVALAAPWRRWGRRGAALPVLAVLVLVAAGPLVRPAYRSSSWLGHNDFVQVERPLAEVPPESASPFFRRIPDAGALVEYPWPTAWRLGRSFYARQRIHGRRVLVSSPEMDLSDPRLALRNHVPPVPEAFLTSSARYLVVHRDLAVEERALVDAATPRGGFPARRGRLLRRAAVRLTQELRARWGEPLYQDRTVVVWDLDAVRAGEASRRTGAPVGPPGGLAGGPPSTRGLWSGAVEALRRAPAIWRRTCAGARRPSAVRDERPVPWRGEGRTLREGGTGLRWNVASSGGARRPARQGGRGGSG